MNASKEECKAASNDFETIVKRMMLPAELTHLVAQVREFFQKAERKLPKEASFARASRAKKPKV